MHELSIALDLIDTASDRLADLGDVRVQALHVRVGTLSGIVADALRVAFDAAIPGTPVDGARLDIEEVPVTVYCASCERERALRVPVPLSCPACGARTPTILRGRGIELVAMEVEDGPTHR